MQLKDFMEENFPDTELKPALFYHWDIGIRFELGLEWKRGEDYPNNPYVLECYEKTIALFEFLHSPIEDIFVVMDINDLDKKKKLKPQLKNLSPYINKTMRFKLKHQEFPESLSEESGEETCNINRFILKCKTTDLNYRSLLKAVCNQDLGLKPSMSHNIYFINIQRKTIFHVYDDRGCDLLAASSDAIKDVYRRYNDWILDYDRSKIDRIFE